ncbi:MAG: amidohydrolase, partial [Nevskia sp.]|nr:amidohydrolase [Nevskia sp.]
AGTDATRVASYDPWNALYWLSTGKTLGGLSLYPTGNCVDRETALQLYTQANTWFSNEEGLKGQLIAGQLADFALLSEDYFSVPESCIRQIVSVLTVVGGNIVHADQDFSDLNPPLPPALPDWSPVNSGSRYWKDLAPNATASVSSTCACNSACGVHLHAHAYARAAPVADADRSSFWGALGCSCWAF